MEIGVQFYTLREHCQNLEDFALSLKKVAEIGYKTVQISGVCEYDAEWLANELEKNGLRCVITHFSPDEIKNNTKGTIDFHNTFGCKNIGLGCLPGAKFDDEHLDAFIKEFPEPAKIIAESGSKLFYHNHDHEFYKREDGSTLLEKILEAFPKEYLGITFDTFWAEYAGENVCDTIDSLAGRLECVHLKDMAIVDGEKRMAPVGHGVMDFEKIIAHLEKAGAKYLLVEQDHCYGEDPFDCLKKSYDYLKSLGLN